MRNKLEKDFDNDIIRMMDQKPLIKFKNYALGINYSGAGKKYFIDEYVNNELVCRTFGKSIIGVFFRTIEHEFIKRIRCKIIHDQACRCYKK